MVDVEDELAGLSIDEDEDEEELLDLADEHPQSGEHSGHYSVRSSYMFLLESTFTDEYSKSFYRSLWNVKCQDKIKIQVWRLIEDYILTRQNLFNRRISNITSCFWCNHHMEFSIHASPPLDVVNVNFDATFKPDSRVATSGVVVRDSLGEIVGTSFRSSGQVSHPFAVETYAIIHVIELVTDLGFIKTIFEGDSLSIIKKLKAAERDIFDTCVLIWDAKAKAQNLLACSFFFVSRMGNQAAYLLASTGFDEYIFWVDESPPSLYSILVADRRGMEPP
ncbi:hypothetical protein GQ457_01G028630 [Hibiscus cannabinus]